ncbi:MAG: hypothetical protein HRU41_25945 [Saprospiraceae bacterium]|nr:hypothetical protein [Saprospiraceae bacterium]
MKDKIIEKIIAKSGIPNLLDLLSDELSPSDWQSLLLAVASRRAAKLSPAQVLEQYQRSRFVHPVRGLQKAQFQVFEKWVTEQLPAGFENLMLSPVTPLATCSSVATVHQNKVLGAHRNLEVVADATNVLALEASLRRKALLHQQPKSKEQVHLATSHRHVRAQALAMEGFTAHFQIQCLLSAGRDEGNWRFEEKTMYQHLAYYLQILSAGPFKVEQEQLEVALTVLTDRFTPTAEGLLQNLQKNFPRVKMRLAPERETGRNYYQTCCFYIYSHLDNGQSIPFCDGGFTDWSQQFLTNRKERLMSSGFGLELWLRLVKGVLDQSKAT